MLDKADITKEVKKDVLDEFYVAEVKFYQLHTCIKEIKVGDTLIMRFESLNKFNPLLSNYNAVRLEFFSLKQNKEILIGYVPAIISASVTAELILNPLRCIVTEVNPDEKTWLQLRVAIIGGTHKGE